jgi:hypothetical protein
MTAADVSAMGISNVECATSLRKASTFTKATARRDGLRVRLRNELGRDK